MCAIVLCGCMALFIICMCTHRGKPGGPDKIMCNPSLEGRQFFYCTNSHSNLTTLFSGRQALPVLKLSAQTQESSGKSKESALHPSFFISKQTYEMPPYSERKIQIGLEWVLSIPASTTALAVA